MGENVERDALKRYRRSKADGHRFGTGDMLRVTFAPSLVSRRVHVDYRWGLSAPGLDQYQRRRPLKLSADLLSAKRIQLECGQTLDAARSKNGRYCLERDVVEGRDLRSAQRREPRAIDVRDVARRVEIGPQCEAVIA